MSYYGAGDYYGAGGIGSFLKGVARTAVGFVTGGPAGAARGALTSLAAPRHIPPPVFNPPFGGAPGVGIGRIGTPAHVATVGDRRFYTKDGRPRRIRKDGKPWGIPSMDAGNTRALKRAARRMDRFVGIARTALQHTKYGVYTRSSRAGKRGRK